MAASLIVLPLKKGIHSQLVHMVLPKDGYMTVTAMSERIGLTPKQCASAAARLIPVGLAHRIKNSVREKGFSNRMFMYKWYSENAPLDPPQSMSEGKVNARPEAKADTQTYPPEDLVAPPEITEQEEMSLEEPHTPRTIFRVIFDVKCGDKYDGSVLYATDAEVKTAIRLAYLSWVDDDKRGKIIDRAARLFKISAQGDHSMSYQDADGKRVPEWRFVVNRNKKSNGKGENIELEFSKRSASSLKYPYTGTSPGDAENVSPVQH